MQKLMLLLLLLSATPAFAGAFCESIDELEKKVNYCDENYAFLAPAKACFQAFKAKVDLESAKIKILLEANAAAAKDPGQQASYENTGKALADAVGTLDRLLHQGKQTYNEIDDYSVDLVLPVNEIYPDDFKIDPFSKEGREKFRDYQCYGEPIGDLEKIKDELQKMIEDLEKTRIAASGKKAIAGARDEGIHEEAKGAKVNGHAAPAKAPSVGGGKGKRPKSSDVTGAAEDLDREKKAESKIRK